MGEIQERDKWGNKLDFILSCLGYAVGLGNVWRFPYLAGQNGGAVFLIPYFILMLLAGLPLFYLELAIGQFAGLSPHLLYRRMCPVFTGISYTIITISVFQAIFYNMVIAQSLYYFAVSFASDLPWRHCNMEWGTNSCWDDISARGCENNETGHLAYWLNRTCTNFTDDEASYEAALEFWRDQRENKTIKSPAEEYLNIRVLHDSGSIENIGTPQWELVGALAGAWVLVLLCLSKGIKSSGKVVWFTATFPYLILLILLIRGVTLNGARDGIDFYFLKPNITKLWEAEVWDKAANQIFFSLSLGTGGLTTLASYNEFNNNILRDTLIVVFGNCLTSVFAGFAIFSAVGYMAKSTGRNVADIAESGPKLAFVAYPSALLHMPLSPVWSVLFFFMLIILGIDSQLVITEILITAIVDQWPALRVWRKKILVVAGVCLGCFLCGLVLTCPGGNEVLGMLNIYASGWTLLFSCLMEVCVVSYVYGIRRFLKDIQLMMGEPETDFWKFLGYPVNPYWWINWILTTPILLSVIMIYSWVQYTPETELLKGVIGWVLSAYCISFVPLFAVAYFIYFVLYKKKPLKWLITPSKLWQPNNERARQILATGQTRGPPTVYFENGSIRMTAFAPKQEQILYDKNL